MDESRLLPEDWSGLAIPDGVQIAEDAHVDTAYSFQRYQSRREPGMTVGAGSTITNGCWFDVGAHGHVSIGEFAVLNDVCIVADGLVKIGDYALISWEVVILDSLRWPRDVEARRIMLESMDSRDLRRAPDTHAGPAAVTIGNNVWIGFGSIILPGVTIGDGSVIGCKSVVTEHVAPYSVYGGNPARLLKRLPTTSS